MQQPTSKVCTGCGIDKPFTEYHRHKGGKYGYRPQCRDCRNAQSRAWRKANPESVRETKRKRRMIEPRWAGNLAWSRRPEVAERRKAAARARTQRLTLRSEADLVADWNRLRPDGLKKCRRCLEHFPRDAFYPNRRMADGTTENCRDCRRSERARGLKLSPGLLAYWLQNGMSPHVCTYCGTDLNYLDGNPSAPWMHVDHIIPVALGGSDEHENLAPACPSCNCSKGARTLVDWLTAA